MKVYLEKISKDKYIIEEKELTRVLSYIKRLENRINRAIAYLEAGKTFPSDEARETVDYMQNILLHILKGSDKE